MERERSERSMKYSNNYFGNRPHAEAKISDKTVE